MFESRPFNNHRNNAMSRYNSFGDIDKFEKSFWENPFAMMDNTGFSDFGTDISDNGKEYVLEADLPGFKKEDIALDVNGNTLTIKAERHSEFEDKDKKGRYIRCERSYGSYSRQFDVSGVDTSKIKAKYDNGILKLTLPKKEQIEGNTGNIPIE